MAVKNEEQKSTELIKNEDLTTSVEIPAKRKKIDNDEQDNNKPTSTISTTPAKKKKFEKQEPQKATQTAKKDNSKNPFAKNQVPNKNEVKPSGASGNPFNKQQAPRQQQTTKQQQAPRKPQAPRLHQAQSTGTNPFKKLGNKNETARPKRDFKAKGKANSSNPNGISDDRLKAYGINPRKFHNRQKYGKKPQWAVCRGKLGIYHIIYAIYWALAAAK